MVEGRRTHSACGVGHWDGSDPQIAHGLHTPLKEEFRDLRKDSKHRSCSNSAQLCIFRRRKNVFCAGSPCSV